MLSLTPYKKAIPKFGFYRVFAKSHPVPAYRNIITTYIQKKEEKNVLCGMYIYCNIIKFKSSFKYIISAVWTLKTLFFFLLHFLALIFSFYGAINLIVYFNLNNNFVSFYYIRREDELNDDVKIKFKQKRNANKSWHTRITGDVRDHQFHFVHIRIDCRPNWNAYFLASST